MRRKWLGWFGALCLLGGGMFAIYQHQSLTITPNRITLPADGAEHQAFAVSAPSGWLASAFLMNQIVESADPRLRLLEDGNQLGRWNAIVTAPLTPGRLNLSLRWRHRTVTIPVDFVASASDSYLDGTPDFVRLHAAQDRQAFRVWFTSIAEAEAMAPPASLPPEIDDCAALLRYAYREALHVHDENWVRAHAFEAPGRSVQQYAYPRTPLGANLFRVRPGPFQSEDLSDGSFAQFADARSLMEYNTHPVSRDMRQARPGDLIFYRQLEQDSPYDVTGASRDVTRYHSPYHSMVIGGEKESWVVYHTGPTGHGKGEMRRMLVRDLLHHPDPRWRPLNENANFLGVYRWNILREGDGA